MYATYDTTSGKVRMEWIGESWELFKAQWGTWVLCVLIYYAISFGVSMALGVVLGVSSAMSNPDIFRPPVAGATTSPAVTTAPDVLAQLMVQAASWLIYAFFASGFYRMANKQVRGGVIELGDLFRGGSVFLPMLGFMVLFGLMCLAGLLCLIVGMFVVMALFWPGYALVADGVSIGDALSRSYNGMKRDWLMAILFGIVFGLVQLFGTVFTCGLGAFALIPMMYLCTSLAYRDMIGMPEAPAGEYPVGYPTGPAQPGVWPPAPETPPYQAPPASAPYPPPPSAGPYQTPPSAGPYQSPPSGPPYQPPAANPEPPGQNPPHPPGGWPPTSQ